MFKPINYTISSLAVAALFFSAPASAITFTESGDAGEAIGTAQILGSISSGDNILGSISSGDVDLYRISIGGGVLTFDTFSGPNLGDPMLFLFDGAGNAIARQDDTGSVLGPLQSQISLNLTAGDFFIGIAAFSTSADNASGDDLFTVGANDLLGNSIDTPDALSGGTVLDVFTGNTGNTGSYNITFTTATAASSQVPEPGTLALFGLGLVGLSLARRRRKSV